VAGSVPTVFMRIAGVPGLEIGATSVATRGNNALEIALALDNTGSMSWNGKLPALKTAAKNMIDTLYDKSPKGSDIRIGLVPFSEYVNVGVANRGQPWLQVAADHSATNTNCVDTYPNKTNCRMEMVDIPDDNTTNLVAQEVCDWGLPVQVCQTLTKDFVWQGCVGSRNEPLDTFDSSALIIPYPGLFDVRCPSATQPLTTDRVAMKTKIDAMIATGNTYIPGGLMWGWNILSARQPFTEGRDPAALKAANGKKALVLMTDGYNTLVPAYPFHSPSADVTVSNAKVTTLCDNIKTDNIIVFTVAFQVNDATVKSLLENCATTPDNFFDASNNALLDQAFEKIALSLATPRLTR
jgi:von Willebrand factor type A domain